jgi:AraC-like DNA-binding protein
VPPVTTDDHAFGLACWSGAAHVMPRAHRHDDIEVNVVGAGRLDYLFGARRVGIPAGTTALFWAALPHQVVDTAEGSQAHWLTVPLDEVLRWRLPQTTMGELLSGAPLLSTTADAAVGDVDAHFGRWSADLAAIDPELREIARLEMRPYLRRTIRVARPVTGTPGGGQLALTRDRAAAMATFVATHFRDPISVAEVAAVVHLHPHYAMELFRATVGSTVGGYLTSCRLAEAQRLLITTDLTVSSVAVAAGFGSSSRLYAAFAAGGLPTPADYRRTHQRAAGW